VTPEDLVGHVRRSSLEGETRRLDRALHRHVDLEVRARQVRGTHPVEEFMDKLNFLVLNLK